MIILESLHRLYKKISEKEKQKKLKKSYNELLKILCRYLVRNIDKNLNNDELDSKIASLVYYRKHRINNDIRKNNLHKGQSKKL